MYIKCLEGAAVTVNGQDISQITNPSRLRHGARVLFGARHYFRVVAPHDPGKEDTASDWQTATSEMLAKEKATIHMIQQVWSLSYKREALFANCKVFSKSKKSKRNKERKLTFPDLVI